jgi:hypothetical protein
MKLMKLNRLRICGKNPCVHGEEAKRHQKTGDTSVNNGPTNFLDPLYKMRWIKPKNIHAALLSLSMNEISPLPVSYVLQV